ncbi:MAG: hypothetical protein EHM23_33100, partial [Acidobacteria bacterium]
MRIAQVCEVFRPSRGGLETYLLQISRELVRQGHSLDVITGAIPGAPAVEYVPEGYRIIRIDYPGNWIRRATSPGQAGMLRQLLWMPLVARYLSRHGGDYDVVHAHLVPSAVAAVLGRQGPKLIWTSHGSYREVASETWGLPKALFYEIAERVSVRLPYVRCITVSHRLKHLL